MALSKNQIKYISSLHQKKHREESRQFIAEGEKIALELLYQRRFKVLGIYALQEWIDKNITHLEELKFPYHLCSQNDMERISALNTPSKVLILLEFPKIETADPKGKQNLILENIQDPGNLGTIIRTADWFGIENIFCSPETVELFNPKVLQATMGSFLRVNVIHTDLIRLLEKYNDLPRYAAVLNGEDAFRIDFPGEMFLMIGNEGKGLSDGILSLQHRKISIPKFGEAESLNAAIATAILCARLKM